MVESASEQKQSNGRDIAKMLKEARIRLESVESPWQRVWALRVHSGLSSSRSSIAAKYPSRQWNSRLSVSGWSGGGDRWWGSTYFKIYANSVEPQSHILLWLPMRSTTSSQKVPLTVVSHIHMQARERHRPLNLWISKMKPELHDCVIYICICQLYILFRNQPRTMKNHVPWKRFLIIERTKEKALH